MPADNSAPQGAVPGRLADPYGAPDDAGLQKFHVLSHTAQAMTSTL